MKLEDDKVGLLLKFMINMEMLECPSIFYRRTYEMTKFDEQRGIV
jgi:hypothetical protein